MKKLITLSVLAIATFFVACHKNSVTPQGTVYLDLPSTVDHYYGFNVYTQDSTPNFKATIGRVLFYDGHLSVNNVISCASCHKQGNSFADNTQFSTGFDGRPTKRNSIGIHNLVGFDTLMTKESIQSPGQPLFWDGRETILLNLVDRPITNHVEMGIADPNTLPSKLAALSIYQPLFFKAYGDSSISSSRISECLSFFMAAIQSKKSRFDLSEIGMVTLTAEEKNGEMLFNNKYPCGNCHHVFSNFYTFSDFHDIGLDVNYSDMGLSAIDFSSQDKGKFRAPSLDNVALTAPYMHDGRFKTLSDVIDHYSHGINNSPNLDGMLRNADSSAMKMNISDGDKQALIAFLNTFTDYSTISDPKFSNPFKIKN